MTIKITTYNAGFLVSLGALGLYVIAMFYLHTEKVENGFAEFLPKDWHMFGHWKFLTVQCLLIQLVNALLHVLAYNMPELKDARDLVFTTLAIPVGFKVAFTFWLVYFGMGREYIFPEKLDEFYPFWLNQIDHTSFVFINLALAILIRHKYTENGVAIPIVYLLGYTGFLFAWRERTGKFIYPYLDEMSTLQFLTYLAGSAAFVVLTYYLGAQINEYFHGEQEVNVKEEHRMESKTTRTTRFKKYFDYNRKPTTHSWRTRDGSNV
uniref:Androgen-dependent TFPI-regulating protein n=1 Tax=Aceria tosichella TaxID=561515 RepID=A0A6G1SNJ0_9ACAR